MIFFFFFFSKVLIINHTIFSEFFADRDLQQFWTFVESIENGDLASIRGAAQPLLRSPSDSALFEFALGLRVYSPRVEAARQALAVSPCDANAAAVALVFPDDVSAEAHVACSATQLQSLLSSSSSGAAATVTSALGRMSLDFDRAFVGSGQRRRVIVHGALGTAAFAAMHSVLKSGGVGYVFRHFDAPAIAEQRSKVPLGGFGVELSLKSVEYKSFDDAAVKDAEGQQKANANAGGDDDGEVMGIQFATLRNRHPQHADSLSKLQEYLYSRDTGFEELRVWEMQSLGVHAAQRVASATDPLALLRQLSSEFPTYATSLSRVKTNESFVGELRTMQQYVHEGHTNHLVLNGRMIDPRKVDAFELYSIVADELNRVAVLDALRISPSDAARLAAIDLSVVPPARFNVPLDRALVLCDLEKDAAYSRWSKSLNAYVHFTPSWHAQFPQVRRNLFTAVFVIEPTSLMSVYSMAMLQRVVMQRFPMRVALLLATPAPRADLSATDLVKLATARAFLAFASELSDLEPSSAAWPGATGLADALALFNAVAQSARQYVPIKSIEQLQEAIGMLTHSYPGLDLTPATLVRGGEHHARVDSLLDSMRAQIEELGLSSDITEPVAFLNGEVISGDDAVNNAIRDMMNAGVKMREAIVNKVITDETVDL